MKTIRLYMLTAALLLTASLCCQAQSTRSAGRSRTVSPAGAVSQASKVQGGSDESILLDAVDLFTAGDYKGAKALLKPLSSNGNDAVLYYLGLCDLFTGNYDQARESLQQACRLDPHNYWYKDRLALCYSALGEHGLTIEIYESLLKEFPKKTDLYYSLANLYIRQNRPDKVLETLDEIETVAGKSEQIALMRYETLMQLQRPEEAFQALKAFNDDYSSPQVLTAMGEYELSQYHDSTAVAYFEEALSYAPSFPPALLGKSEAQRIQRNYNGWFGTIRTFISDNDIPAASKTHYLNSLFQQLDPQFLRNFKPQVDSLVDLCLECHPSDSTALHTAASYYYSTNRNAKGMELLEKEVQLYPQSLSARSIYVQALGISGQLDDVIEQAEKGFQDFPAEKAFLEMKTAALYQKEDYTGVISECERMIAAAPGDSLNVLQCYSTIGECYHKMGETSRCYSAYRKALKIDKEYTPVLNNYAYFLCLQGKSLGKAYNMSKVTVQKEPDNATYLDTFGWILFCRGKAEEAKPFFKHALLYGGKDSAAVLDHYAEVLYSLKEYDLAKYYWNLAKSRNTDGQVPDLDERVSRRIASIKK